MNTTVRKATGKWSAMVGMSLCLAAGWLGNARAQQAAPRPLPLAANWCAGHFKAAEQYSPDWQIEMIEKGHHLLFSIHYSGRVQGAWEKWVVSPGLTPNFLQYAEKARNGRSAEALRSFGGK